MQPSKLLEFGQSLWLDSMRRQLLTSGELARLRDEGVRGVTSNPSIFEKAFAGSQDYEQALARLERQEDRTPAALYETLAVEDIAGAADVLRPVYERSERADGFACLEVSPRLAHDTQATVEEARRLWRRLDRDNVMIKVPATAEGIPAIRQLISEGINVNVTLLFAESTYGQVAEAYLDGLEAFRSAGGDPGAVASVASIFVSRFDVMVDPMLEEMAGTTDSRERRETLRGLVGKVGIANAKRIYRAFREVCAGPRFQALSSVGARPQRILFASTSTKDARFSDVMYVEELIGPDTVDTVPPATLDALRDHATAAATLERDSELAEQQLDQLEQLGISLNAITDRLLAEGVDKFAVAFDRLLATLEKRREGLLGPLLDRTTFQLPKALDSRVNRAIDDFQERHGVSRLWQRDASLWTGDDEGQWLDWLRVVDGELSDVDDLRRFGEQVQREGFTQVALLGMGGSSLFADVLSRSFPRTSGWPELRVLDSTDPQQISRFELGLDLPRTLFVVASKSGSTLEPNLFEAYFWAQVTRAVGADRTGAHFVAITDPGSPLERKATERGYRRVFHGVIGIGGRYSALSNFGLVPAAVMGLDVTQLLDNARRMVHACASCVPAEQNPGVAFGVVLGSAVALGRNKVTLVMSPPLRPLGAWIEQLLAESTGKHGKGLIPVYGEPLGSPSVYGDDRVFVYLRHDHEADREQDAALATLAEAGHPVVRFDLAALSDLTQEVFRWEVATAVAGSLLGLNPFDQPDVEAAKEQARLVTDEYERTGHLAAESYLLEEGPLALFADGPDRVAIEQRLDGDRSLGGYLRGHLGRLESGDYVALLAWIERSEANQRALDEIRSVIRDRYGVATCVGFGPRFLHSTGQLFKGGPASGVFLHLVSAGQLDLSIPGQRSSFGVVEQAQARGDFRVLVERERRVLGVDLGPSPSEGLEQLLADLEPPR